MLAERTQLFTTSATAAARAAAATAAAHGKPIADLTNGEIFADLPPAVRAGAIAAVESGANRYTDTIGMAELRHAISQRMTRQTGASWSSDEIAVTAGAKQALFHAAMVLLNPGDEVIIPAPYWTTFPAQVLLAGGRPIFVESRGDSYLPHLEDIEAAVTSVTRAIIVNTPVNPSGAVYDRATLAGIAELALAHDLWVIFDECYGTFTYEPHVHEHIVSIAPQVRSRTIIVNAFSKQLAMTGWRIGYLAAPPAVIKAVRALQSHTTSNPNVIAQHAVLFHLQNTDGVYERELHARLAHARRLGLAILGGLKKVPAPCAQGGFYFYLNLETVLQADQGTDQPRTADDVVATLLAEGVAAVSGTAFGDPYGLRLSYGASAEHLETGLHRLVEVINSWS